MNNVTVRELEKYLSDAYQNFGEEGLFENDLPEVEIKTLYQEYCQMREREDYEQ